MQGMPTSQGPGWWQASDMLWYPPEAAPAPNPPVSGTVAQAPVASYTAPAGYPPATSYAPPVASYAPPAMAPYSVVQAGPQVAVPAGTQLSSLGKRFGGYLLDGLLAIVTLGIGYLVWMLITWSKGQSPGKQLLKMRCIDQRTGRAATWGTMFVREFVIRGLLIGVIGAFTLGILPLVAILMIFGMTRQTLWDRMASTIVVDDPQGVTLR
jgi:hypothetical protein